MSLKYNQVRYTGIQDDSQDASMQQDKQTYLLIIMAVMTGSHPEWRTVLVAGCLAAMTIPIGVRAKKKAATKGDT